jgi:hypothetical protein
VSVQFRPLTEQFEWEWFTNLTHVIRCEDMQGIVAYAATGKILAVMVADSFSPDSCNLHVAIDNPVVIKYGFLNECFRHIFHTRRRNHVFGMVPANNARALKFNEHIGFTEVARIPDGVGTGTDYIILRLDKADCRWISHEQEERVA